MTMEDNERMRGAGWDKARVRVELAAEDEGRAHGAVLAGGDLSMTRTSTRRWGR